VAQIKLSVKRNLIWKSLMDNFPKPGTFVEFGAFDGMTHSLGHFLFKEGWGGYYTEPIPEAFVACRNRYRKNKNIVVDRVAIGGSNSWLKMHIGGLVSTGNDSFQEHTKQSPFKRLITGSEIKVRMMTLNGFLEKHDVPEGFDLLIVDVEGMEWEVFRSFDIGKWKPRAILVEMHQDMLDWEGVGGCYKKTEEFLLDRGYHIAVRTRVNTLFYGS
jgi:FkbM family methyltransferase